MTSNPSNLISCTSFIARKVSFSIVLKRGGKTGKLRLCMSLSAFLMNALFLGRLNGASIAMSGGLHSRVLPMISLSLKRWQAEITRPFSVPHPVRLLGLPARSMPTMMSPRVFNVFFPLRLMPEFTCLMIFL